MSLEDWRPPAEWVRICTIDLHTAGEPFRVFAEGYPELAGDTILERRRIRPRAPRPPPDRADVGAPGPRRHVRLHRHAGGEPKSRLRGVVHPQRGLHLHVRPRHHRHRHGGGRNGDGGGSRAGDRIGIDTPAGLVRAWARVENGRVAGVRFHNVPSFVSRSATLRLRCRASGGCDSTWPTAARSTPMSMDRCRSSVSAGPLPAAHRNRDRIKRAVVNSREWCIRSRMT